VIDESAPTLLDTREAAARAAAARAAGKSRRARLGLILLAVVLGLVVFEVGMTSLPRGLTPGPLRTINTFYTRRAQWEALIAGDAYLGFKLRPDVEVQFPFEAGAISIRTTSHGLGKIGFRDVGTHAPYRAIAVGDSFTFCDEVRTESCWVRRLSDARGVSIATLGVSGYSTLAEARVLKRYGPTFNPELVMVGFFPNDLPDNVNFDEWVRSGTDDLPLWLQRSRGRHPLTTWLEEHSIVYRLGAAALRSRGRDLQRHRDGGLDLVLRFDDWWIQVFNGPERHPGWPMVRDGLLDMKNAAAEMGARLVVLIFPTKEEAYWDIARRYLPSAAAIDIDRLPRLLNGFLAEHGILGCDLTGELREQARNGRQLYHRVSGHFNDEGNRVAAVEIDRCLARHGVLHGGQREARP
jgi:hypothetical protein